MSSTQRIRRHERGLRFRRGRLVAVLPSGTHRLWRRNLVSRLLGRDDERLDVVSTLDPVVRHPALDELLDSPAFRASVSVLTLTRSQRARVWKDGRLVAILGPGRHALWNPNANEATRLRVETIDVLPRTPREHDHPQRQRPRRSATGSLS